MTGEGLLSLQLVDRSQDAPSWFPSCVDGVAEIQLRDVAHQQTGELSDLRFHLPFEHVQYVPFASCETLGELEAAIVVTGARDHLSTIKGILSSCRELRVLICEKPCGDSLAEFADAHHLCEAAGVQLVVSDHSNLHA